MSEKENIQPLTAHLFRENSGKMVAVLSRIFGLRHIDTVMDVVQDTFEEALQKWRFAGVPENPSAWLMQVAKNKAINAFKRESKTEKIEPSEYLRRFDSGMDASMDIFLSPLEIKDSQLRLLITCCQLDLSVKNQIALTLHVLCGFGVPEISNALMTQEEAIKKSLSRSKATLRNMDDFLQVKPNPESDRYFPTAITVLYLMFNEGYKTTRAKEGIDNDLCFEAIRLSMLLEPEAPKLASEVQALRSLMFFNLSRFPSRINAEEEWMTLAEQDRSRWNKVFIEEGYHYLHLATQSDHLSRYHIEAIIASVHCAAARFEETDWKKIAYLYRQLELLEPDSPMITLNRIIAESYVSSENSIENLGRLADKVAQKNKYLIDAARGDIFSRSGDYHSACKAYAAALRMAVSPADKRFLKRKMIQCQTQQN